MAFDAASLTYGQRRLLLEKAKAVVGDANYRQFVSVHGEDALLSALLQLDEVSTPQPPPVADVHLKQAERLSEIWGRLPVYYLVGLLTLILCFSFRTGGFSLSWSWWYLVGALPVGAPIVGVARWLWRKADHLDKVENFFSALKMLVICCFWVPGVGVLLGSWFESVKSYGWLTAEGVAYLIVIGPLCLALSTSGWQLAWRVNAIGAFLVGLGMIVVGVANGAIVTGLAGMWAK